MSKSVHNQNKETEMIDIPIPYIPTPLITEEDTVLQNDDHAQESHDDVTVSSDNETKIEIVTNTSEKKIVGYGPFIAKCKIQMMRFLQFVK